MKLMLVCTSNICRSAMGHALMEKRVKELNKDIEVYSCGIYAGTGDKATNSAIQTMKQYNVDLLNHRATNIHDSNIEDMDLILCATVSHKNAILEFYPEVKEKLYTIKEYANYDPNGLDKDIKDPYGWDMETYERCAKEIVECVELILKKL